MGYYFLPGLLFLLLTSVILWVATFTEPQGDNWHSLAGQKAPAMLADPMEGFPPLPNPILLAASSGKPVMINFMASWCTPCTAEMPYLHSLSERFDLHLIGIAWNDTPSALKPWLDKTNAPFQFVGLDDGSTAERYGVNGIPASFLLDSSGTVLWQSNAPITPEMIAQELAPILQANHRK